MLVKLLIDEDLSPRCAQELRARGVDAVSVRDRGHLSATDEEVFRLAYVEDRVLITANVRDFEEVCRKAELHPGVVLIEDGALRRDAQIAAVVAVHEFLEASEDGWVNRAVYFKTGRFRVVDLPPGG